MGTSSSPLPHLTPRRLDMVAYGASQLPPLRISSYATDGTGGEGIGREEKRARMTCDASLQIST